MFFKTFAKALKLKDVRRKLFNIFIALLVYRLGAHIYLPALNLKLINLFKAASKQSLFAIISSGGYASIFALGIGPYITASIILQLLTVAIPSLEQLKKDGKEGRKKIDQYTRLMAILLSLMQGAGYIYMLKGLFIYQNFFVYAVALIALVTGSIFVMWLGEMLNEYGMGNGSSFIIFANILSGLPNGIMNLYPQNDNDIYSWIKIGSLILLFIIIMAFVIWVQDGERRISVQYSKKTAGVFSAKDSYIPIKINIAGVMSIIFAISLMQFPATVYQIWHSDKLKKIVEFLDITNPWGTLIYVFLIFCFTFFYTSFTVNSVEIAENIKKSGGFIPGIRPGKPTSDYIQNSINKLSWIGALFYAIVAIMPVILEWVFKIKVGFGGTTLLIVTGVALEIIKQLDSQLLVRNYKGFLS